MYQTQSTIITIDIWFIVEHNITTKHSFYFDGDVSDHSDPEVAIPPGSQLVTMHLRTTVNPEALDVASFKENEVKNPQLRANYTSQPLQWVTENGVPRDVPGAFSVSRIDGDKVNIFACNTLNQGDEPEIYPVRLLAMYEGDIFWTADPTMVNLPENP